MPLWMCDFEDCQSPALRRVGDCELCDRHLCSQHLEPESHGCPNWEDDLDGFCALAGEAKAIELTKLFNVIDTRALEARASSLRGGLLCFVSPLTHDSQTTHSVMGGMNYHVVVVFEDGVEWIARIRRTNAISPPKVLRDQILQSEFATLKFLETTAVPTPTVHDFALEGQPGNDVGVGYILMDKMPGTALKWREANDKQRAKVIGQYANCFIELHKHSFELIGSLQQTDGNPFEVGPFASENLSDCDAPNNIRTLGPFSSSQDCDTAEIKFILDLIVRGEMYPPQMAVDGYLAHLFLLDLVPKISSSSGIDENSMPDGNSMPKAYLRHADDKGDHILVDENFSITGIIDWEWAQVVPAERAFNSSCGFMRVPEFYAGSTVPCEEELLFAEALSAKGRDDLAHYVRHGRVIHFFTFCVGCNLGMDWSGFVGLFRGLRDAAGVDAGLDWEEWKIVALERYKDDDGLKGLLAKYPLPSSTHATSADVFQCPDDVTE